MALLQNSKTIKSRKSQDLLHHQCQLPFSKSRKLSFLSPELLETFSIIKTVVLYKQYHLNCQLADTFSMKINNSHRFYPLPAYLQCQIHSNQRDKLSLDIVSPYTAAECTRNIDGNKHIWILLDFYKTLHFHET